MKQTFFQKIFFGFLVIIGLFFISVLFLVITFVNDFRFSEFIKEVEKETEHVKTAVIEPLSEKETTKIHRKLKRYCKNRDAEIMILDMKGNVLVDSQSSNTSFESKNHPEIQYAALGIKASGIRYDEASERDLLYFALPLNYKEEALGILYYMQPLEKIKTFQFDIRKRILVSAAMVTLLSLIISIFISKEISNPLKRFIGATTELSRGNFDTQVTWKKDDEVHDLARSFNTMAWEIKHLFEKISQQKEELDVMFSNMQEGLCILEETGKIIHFNSAFRSMALHTDETGQQYKEALKSTELIDLINKVMLERKDMKIELQLRKSFYLISFTFMKNQKLMILISNIDKIKKLQQIKKDFVANLSHELRTPLTAILGFTDILEEEETHLENQEYLTIIKRHTQRLIHMVNEILTLSKIEQEEQNLTFETIDLQQLISNIVRLLTPKAVEKNLALILQELPDMEIEGDFFKLEQLFINLIDNAIKYTMQGEIQVEVQKYFQEVEIVITDTGTGIPKEDLGRVFERFYVVDKSRSRQLGGSGLGLSIVKHIVLLHKGKIAVKSKGLGHGTSFHVILPYVQRHSKIVEKLLADKLKGKLPEA